MNGENEDPAAEVWMRVTQNTWKLYHEARKQAEREKSMQPPKPTKRRRRGGKTYGRSK